VATISQKYHGKKVQPLLGLKTTDSKIIDSMAQNIVIAIPMAIRLHIFSLAVMPDLPPIRLALFYKVLQINGISPKFYNIVIS
jgi:hypothetical protein